VDRELEVIRDEMEHTRASLADKLGALETQVRETVSTASETVTSTVEGVKEVVDTVSDTVGSVTDTFNVSKQVEENPWLAMGIAVAAGFVVGQLLSGTSQPAPQPQPQPAPQPPTPAPVPVTAHASTAPAPESPGITDRISSMLPSLDAIMPDLASVGNTVVSGLTGLAVGSVMGVVREMVVNGLPPEWKGELTKLVDQVTTQLGGKPQPAKPENPPPPSEPEQRSQEPGKGNGREQERRAPRGQFAHQI
jgi:ElaB/YqjD/DUF883 family membrane-anchored ribosome-binding protein